MEIIPTTKIIGPTMEIWLNAIENAAVLNGIALDGTADAKGSKATGKRKNNAEPFQI